MRIQNTLSTVIVFLIAVFVAPFAFSANIGRNVYGVFTETYNGAHSYTSQEVTNAGGSINDADAVTTYFWGNGSVFVGSEGTNNPHEGVKYIVISPNGNTGWGGMGFACTNTSDVKDMSAYHDGYLKFYARSNNSNVATNYQFGIKVGTLQAGEVWLNLSSYAFSANGSWHEITVPLNTTTHANLTSENLKNITQLFMLLSSTVNADDSIDIDNIVWVKKDNPGTFSPVLKNRYNGNTVTSITWSSGTVVGNNAGWTVADQYIKLDLDKYVTDKNWTVTVYTSSDTSTENGLVSVSGHKIPMAFRITNYELPYANESLSLSIGEKQDGADTHLYDSGLGDQNYYCWLWAINVASEDHSTYDLIWSNDGYKGAEATFHGMSQTTLEMYPKVYIAGRFINIIGGNYKADIVIEFKDE